VCVPEEKRGERVRGFVHFKWQFGRIKKKKNRRSPAVILQVNIKKGLAYLGGSPKRS
jgi:hypothetical protein